MEILFTPGKSLWCYAIKITLVMEIPECILTGILILAYNAGWYHPDLRPSPFLNWSLTAIVLVGPVLESFALAGLASALSKRLSNPMVVSSISGLAWGWLHAQDFGLSFFCPSYDFFIMTTAYLAWRPKSFWHGYLAALIPHLFHDIKWKFLTLY